MNLNPLFPIFLKANQLKVLIVGGGYVALEKLTALWNNSLEAEVKLVAPEIKKEIKDFLSTDKQIEILERKFEVEDLEGIDWVIIAVGEVGLSEAIRIEAKKQNLLVNVAETSPAAQDAHIIDRVFQHIHAWRIGEHPAAKNGRAALRRAAIGHFKPGGGIRHFGGWARMAGADTNGQCAKAKAFPDAAFQYCDARCHLIQSLDARLLARHPFLRLCKTWQAK